MFHFLLHTINKHKFDQTAKDWKGKIKLKQRQEKYYPYRVFEKSIE